MASDLVDPFDNPQPQARSAPPPALVQGGGLRDPFDDPGFNRPTAELRNNPRPDSRPSTGPVVSDSMEGAARLGTTLRAGMPPDPNDEIKRFAAARFPELPIEEAVKRYGVIDGNVVYSDPQTGKLVREVPSLRNASGPIDFFRRAGQQAASGFFPALPGILGGMAALPFAESGPGSVAVATGVAGATDAARQAADRYMAGENPLEIDPLNVGGQMLMAGGGQLGGNMIGKALNRNALGVSAADKIKATNPQTLQEWLDLAAEAKARGVNLSAGQISNLYSLRQKERMLGRWDETMDQVFDFTKKQRGEQVPQAMRAELDKISPDKPAYSSVENFRRGAAETLESMEKGRSAAVEPYYRSAFDSGVTPDVAPILQEIDGRLAKLSPTSAAARALNEFRASITMVDDKGARVPIGDYEALHSAKMNADSAYKKLAAEGFDNNAIKEAQREVLSAKRALNQTLKDAHPGYAEGSAIYASMSPEIKAFQKGSLTQILRDEGVDRVSLIGSVLDFGRTNPAEVTRARGAFLLAGKKDEWNDGVRAWLSDKLSSAIKEGAGGQGNVPGKLYSSIWGDERQRDIVKAAIGDADKVAGMESLMKVLQAAGRSLPEGSPTATDIGGMRQGALGGAAKVAGKVFSANTYANPGDAIIAGIDAVMTPAGRQKLANYLLSPDSMNELGKLRMLSPTSQKAISLTSEILTSAGLVSGLGAAGAYDLPDTLGPDARAR